MMKRALSVILALVMLLTLVGCGNESGNEGTQPAASGEAVAQYYNTYMTADPTSMDISRISDSYSSGIVNNVMESLVRMGEVDGNYVIIAGDAQPWESNAEGTVWTFHLGDNTWSDGQPVTAQDYVYSLRRSADPATGCPNGYFQLPVAGYNEVRDGGSLENLGV